MSEVASGAIRSGYRWELDRAIRTNNYLRVFFSTGLLIYAGFGPGLLIRFPVSVGGVSLEAVAKFYAFRPVIFALLFVALACVLAALARRALLLFERALDEDTEQQPGQRRRYIADLRPPAFPFVLSGHIMVDLSIAVATLVAYGFWVILLVETIPLGMGVYQTTGIILGCYGLFGSLIVTAFVWYGLARRVRRLAREADRLSPPV
jgi:hypothetical protein